MKSSLFKKSVLVAAMAIILVPVATTANSSKVRQYGKGAPFLIDELPQGKVKSKLKSLPHDRQQKAMKWLHSFVFTSHDLEHIIIDDEGGVLFGDSFDLPELTATTEDPVEPVQAISATETFKLHSKPGASNVIYIDVDGHSFSNTAWSSATINARAFDTDGNVAAFNSAELTQIAEIWHRIAEDYAPFDTDVTTEEPAHFGPTTGRILITHNKEVSGGDMPHSTAGGVAYVNVWGRSNYASYYSPALVYYNNLASYAPYISEAASHEMGHNLGLSHDGTSTASYYTGHGSGFVSWGPIMGVGYYTNVTQWSKGEYTGASQQQDDIQIISSHLSARADDHGDDIFNPTALQLDAQGNISSTSPETDPLNIAKENKGIIGSSQDVDFFTFEAGSGPLDIVVTPAWESFYNGSRRGANLDIKIDLYDWDGKLIASHDPIDETDAQIQAIVTSGQYLLAVTGVGNSVSPFSDYGSLGQYFISGKIEPFSVVTDTTAPTPNPMGWSVAPYSQSRNSVSMQATTAVDESGGVQYNFICVSGNCTDSGWQPSNQYTATGLVSATAYSFQVIAKDGYGNETQASAVASATTAANNPPVTIDSTVSTLEDTRVTIDLLSQSSDADADALSFSVQAVANGSISHNNGIVTYTPNSNFNGLESLNYTVNDGFGGIATGTVFMTVISVNDTPTASASVPESSDSLSVGFSSANSFDPDSGDVLSYFWDFGDGNSSTFANPVHSYADFGSYTITLTVTDEGNSSDSVVISTNIIDTTNTLPETPTNLSYQINQTVTGKGKNRTVSGAVELSWGDVRYADSYTIWQCVETVEGRGKNKTTTCGNYKMIGSSFSPSFSASLSSSTVRIKVTADNLKGSSDFSNEVVVKP